jgi:zinc protease
MNDSPVNDTGLMKILGPVFDMPIDRFVLPNGMTVIHRAVSGGLAAVQLWVKTGSIHEAPYLGCGLSHYLEHMLFKGTARRSAPQITAEIQAIGGDINAYTTFDRTVYHIEAPSEGFSTAIDILHDMAFNSQLDSAELTREREVILREIAMNNDDPDRQLMRGLYETVFRDHPFRYPVIGHSELFKTIDEATIRGYYKARYVPGNMVLIVLGDINIEALELALESTFAKEPRTQLSTPVIPGELPQLAPRRAFFTADVSICRGSIAYRVPGIGHEDAPALDMLASILGNGESAVLCQALRMRRQLVNDIDVSCWNPGKTGLLWLSYNSDTGTSDKVEAAIYEEIKAKIKAGFTQEELDRSRRLTLTSEIDSRKTVSSHASRLGLSEVVVGDLFYPRQYFESLSMLTTDDVLRAANKYITSTTRTVVTLDADEAKAHIAGTSLRVELAPPELIRLPNGARIVLQPDHTLPKVHIRYGALGGPLYETATTQGATALLATLLTRDTQARSAENVSRTIESAGGRFDEFCGNNSFGVAMELLSSGLDTGLDLLEYSLLKPDFNPTTFEVERAGQIARIQEYDDDISERGRVLLRRAFYGDHPYKENPNGTVEALEKLVTRDIAEHYGKLVRAGNSVISVCGDFDPARTLPRLELILSSMPVSEFVPQEPPFRGPKPCDFIEHMDREQAIVFRSFRGPGVRGDDNYVADLLDEVLSDMSGPLFVSARERKGLAYFVGASRMTGIHTGMFSLYGGTRPDQVPMLRAEFDAVLEDIRQRGISEAELQRGKTRLKSRRRLSMQTIGSRANHVLLETLYGLTPENVTQFDAHIDAISMEDIRSFARNYLREDARVDFAIGPLGKTPEKRKVKRHVAHV